MESVELEINGRMNTVHSDGSISWIHGRTGKLVNGFGTKDSDSYMRISIGGKMHRMHRIVAQAFLVDFLDFPTVDHIDGDKLNNRLENLRMATGRFQNMAHQNKRKGCSSQYRGVSWYKNTNRWLASCKINGKDKHLGYFDSEREAAIARDTYAFSQGFSPEGLNFPECFISS
jgi:hypothetical protein|tara:strand:- start:113 stop:631 length:519 start_codon:yes stop_codon:yes gene_type:complete